MKKMTAMTTIPAENNDTFRENIDSNQTSVEGAPLAQSGPALSGRTSCAAGGSAPKSVSLGGKNYTIVKQFEVLSGEADIYLIENSCGSGPPRQSVLKLFRLGVKPKAEISLILSSLPGNAVIGIIESGETAEGRFYEIQEFASRGSLREYMKTNSPAPEEFVMEFVFRLNECLRHIHSKNVIHRDIKPDNILIKNFAPLEIVLADFGISSVAEFALHQTTVSRTILYSSPESMTGVISAAVDYWALGIITLEMLSGAHPFAGVDEKAVIYWLATKPVTGIVETGPEFECLLKGLLTRDPHRRWGYEEVAAFCAGGAAGLKHHFEEETDFPAPGATRKCRPYKFEGADHYSLQSLAAAMAVNWRAAARDFESGRLRNWVARELRDGDARFLLEDLAADAAMTTDEKLLEFFCRTDSGFPFIYMGVPVCAASLADISVKILRGTAADDEIKLVRELARGGAAEKYYELSGNDEVYNGLRPLLEELSKAPDDAEIFAKVILINCSPEYKDKLAERVRSAVADSFIIRAFDGAGADAPSISRASGIVDSIINGGQFSALELIAAAEAGRECLFARSALEEMFADFRSCLDSVLKESTSDEFRAGFEKFMRRRVKSLNRGEPQEFHSAVIRLAVSAIEYNHKFYETLLELNEYLQSYKVKTALLKSSSFCLDLGGGASLEMVRIQPGTFVMGCDDGYDDEAPAHRVSIRSPFYIGKTPLTQKQWECIMKTNPSYFKRGGDYPVEKVSWNDCVEFIKKLNSLNLVEAEFRLPTEAEWEYSARAGSETKYHWGDDPAAAGDHCWHRGNSSHETHPCAQKLPNAFGLFDTAGNVREWCADWYAPYDGQSVADPRGPESGNLRIARGGDWKYEAKDCTASGRDCIEPAFRDSNLGFRLAME